MDAALEWVLSHWNDITVAALLFVILVGGSKKAPWWVFGWLYQERVKEANEWKKLALRGTGLAKKAVKIAETKVVEDDDLEED